MFIKPSSSNTIYLNACKSREDCLDWDYGQYINIQNIPAPNIFFPPLGGWLQYRPQTPLFHVCDWDMGEIHCSQRCFLSLEVVLNPDVCSCVLVSDIFGFKNMTRHHDCQQRMTHNWLCVCVGGTYSLHLYSMITTG